MIVAGIKKASTGINVKKAPASPLKIHTHKAMVEIMAKPPAAAPTAVAPL